MTNQYCICEQCGKSTGIDANITVCFACSNQEEDDWNSEEAKAYRKAAAAKMGSSKSPAKVEAAKANGAKGGRPKSAKTKYFDLAGSNRVAVEYEESVFQSGREFLPACAITVLDGGDATDEYWSFLIDQWNKMA